MTTHSHLENVAEKLAKTSKRQSSNKKSTGTFDADGRRVIRHDAGRLPEIVNELADALAEYDENLFVYMGSLFRIYPAPESPKNGIRRARGTLILHPVTSAHLIELAGLVAIHERYDVRTEGYKPCNCPKNIVDSYLARGNWPELRTLSAFVEAPTVTLEGRLIDRPGYDQETGLFLAFKTITGYSTPPARPTLDDAAGAADRLMETVCEFPFVDESDKSAFLAGVLTGLLRRILEAAPMMAITAPTPGTGKTLIAETFAIIATGRRASVLSLGQDDAETEKRLGGVLLAGDACIALDNIERPLKGELLCQVASQQYVRLRPLGASAVLNIPTHALLVATGNNLSIVGDLKRRVSLIRMDACQERPERRTFKRNHLDDIFNRRGALIRDALTICLAYLGNGAPPIDGLYPLGGFEQWDRMVRRPLVWLGLPDPLKASESLREQDPDMEAMRLLFGSWNDVFSDKAKTAAEIVAAGMDAAPMTSEYVYPELRDALQLVCSEKINTRRLGYWLRNHKDRIVDGLTLRLAGSDGHSKIGHWSIASAAASVASGETSIPF